METMPPQVSLSDKCNALLSRDIQFSQVKKNQTIVSVSQNVSKLATNLFSFPF